MPKALIADLLTRCNFPEAGTEVACGLSGGPDSSSLVALAIAADLKVEAWHINHHLHPNADDHEHKAEIIADQLGASFVGRDVYIDTRSNIEEQARAARYEALPDDVMVGHTADDRAETILFNIARGGGLQGAAATFSNVRRPILNLRRHETQQLCQALKLDTVDDPMNADDTFARVAIRNNVIPALAEALNRDCVPLINRHGDHMRDAQAVIAAQAAALDPTNVKELAAAPVAVATEALRQWLTNATTPMTANPTTPTTACIDRVLDVVHGVHKATEITGGYRVTRTKGVLRIEPPALRRQP